MTLSGFEGDTMKLSADQIPAVGTKPGEANKAGSWDTVPSAETEIKTDTVYTYTYAAKEEISAKVTFKVAGGAWDDGKTEDVTVTLSGLEGDTLKLSADQIPAVGTKPGEANKAGSWDTVPDTETEIKADTVYTYAEKETDSTPTEKTFHVSLVTGTGETIDRIVADGGAIVFPEGLAREGFTFAGWYRDEAGQTAWNADQDTVTEDVTLYGIWKKSVTGVSVAPESVVFTMQGETAQITAYVTPEDADNRNVTYASSNENVATVDASGVITAVADGTAEIIVVTEDGGRTAVLPVTVQIPAPQPATEDTAAEDTAEQAKKAAISINAGLKISQTGSKIKVKWGKVTEADGYKVYAAYCGKKFGKPVMTIKGSDRVTAAITKLGGKKISLKKNFKLYVTAYRLEDGKETELAKTITGHVVGRLNSKYSNAKKITLKKAKVTVAAGKTVKVSAKTVLVDPGKKQLTNAHAKEFRYASTDESVATVDAKGTIKGVGAGSCTVYVYARNGYAKKVSVTVK